MENNNSGSSQMNMVFKAVFNATNEGMAIVGTRGEIVLVNDSLCKIFQYTHAELIGRPIEFLVPDEYKEVHVSHRSKENVAEAKKIRSFGEGKYLSGQRKDGEIIPLEISLSSFQVDEDHYHLALVSDVSARVEHEQELRKSESFLKQAEILSKSAHFEIDIESGTMNWSDQLYRILKEDINSSVPKHVRDIIQYVHPEDKSLVLDTYFNCIRTKTPIDIRFRVIVEKGKVIYVHNTGILNDIDKEGHLHTVFSTVQDITSEYKIEEELRELNTELENRVIKRTKQLEQNQYLYKMIARNFPNGTISVFDKDLNYVFVEGKELYKRKITGKMLIGTSFLERVDPEVRDDIEQKLRTVCNYGDPINFELETRDKTYMINAVCLKGEADENNHILMVSQNITSLKKAEEDIQASLQKEQQLNELKTRFVSTASHEFRTPLTTILNSNSLLQKYIQNGGDEERQLKHLDRIKNSAKHLTSILNDFLSIDKIEHGDFILSVNNVDIPSFSENVISDLDSMLKDGQSINYNHDGNREFYSDKQMLTYILNNLLSNAIKYSNDNTVISLTTKVSDQYLELAVTDQGIGIPKEEQERMFSRFFRARNAENEQGTGLGLTIVKNYVDRAGGSIDFESEENKGSTFTITLPNNT